MFADLTAFLTAKTAAGLSPRTLSWYEMLIRQYLDWSDARKLPKQKPETVEAFLTSQREAQKSPFTISGSYRALCVYFKWLVGRKRLRRSPMADIQPPHVPKRRKRHITATDFRRLYLSIDGERWTDQRDRLILLILMYAGLRASELLALTYDDIDRARCLLHVDSGKGDRDRDVPFARFVLEQLDAYLAAKPTHPSQRLLLSHDGGHGARGPLSYEGLKEIMRRRCEAAGIKRFGPHTLRHSYAMIFLNDGELDLLALSQTLGHSSIDVTRRFYADFDTTSLRRKYAKAADRVGNLI